MRRMSRFLTWAACGCLVATASAAAPCAPSTLAGHIALGASGCELLRAGEGSQPGRTLAVLHDLQFEIERSVGVALSAAAVVLVPGGPAWPGAVPARRGGPPSWWFDSPTLGEGDEVAYRITYTVDFVTGGRGALRVTGGSALWPVPGVRTLACLGAAFEGDACAGEEWVVGERSPGRSFPPVTVIGLRHDVWLTEGMSGFAGVAAGRGVPEPAALVLLCAGLAGASWRRRRIGLSTRSRRTCPAPVGSRR